MKTRIVYTKIWKDDWFLDLSDSAQRLFLFLLTCEDIGLTGIFELSDREIFSRTRLCGEALESTKTELDSKVLFHICIRNANKHYNYSGIKNVVAFNKEITLVPQEIRDYFKGIIHNQYTIDTLSSTTDTPINHKSKIINHSDTLSDFTGLEELRKTAKSLKGIN